MMKKVSFGIILFSYLIMGGCHSKSGNNLPLPIPAQANIKDSIKHTIDSIARIIFPKIETDLEQLGLRGKVKMYERNFFDAHDSAGKIIMDSSRKYNEIQIYSFDANGNKIEFKTFARDGKIDQHHIFQINKNEKLDYVIEDNIKRRYWGTKYDSLGHIIEEDNYFGEDQIDRTKYTLDDKGREIASETKFEDSLENYATTVYFKNGDFVTREYKPDETLDKSTVYSYDDKGNELAEMETDSAGAFSSKVIYVNDSLGNIILATYYSAVDTVFLKTFYSYNKYGNKIEELEYSMPKDSLVFKYNWIIECDEHGNAVKEIHKRNNKTIGIEIRKFEYYR